MTKKIDLDYFFKTNDLKKLIISYQPEDIAKECSFREGLRIAYRLLFDVKRDESFQDYAIRLFEEIRLVHSTEWNASWEYDALLGLAYHVRCEYEERYEAYRRAFDKALDPPPGLLIAFAHCCICPGHPPITYDYAVELVLRALKNNKYVDGFYLLAHLYSLKEDEQQSEYWRTFAQNADQYFTSPSIDPQFLVDDYLKSKHAHQETA
jgi:hypothetical protein